MEQKIFDKICNNLGVRVKWCEENLKPILCKEDMEKISVSQYQNILKTARTYMSDMDKIYAELHHIVFVSGLLTVQQQSKIVSLMQRFCNYRSDLKVLSHHSCATAVPGIPADAEYDFSVLLKGKIKIARRGSNKKTVIIERQADVKEPTSIENSLLQEVVDKPDTYYYLGEDNKIHFRIDPEDDELMEKFRLDLGLALGVNVKEKNFKKNIRAGGCGYSLILTETGNGLMEGTTISNNQRDKKYTKYYLARLNSK